VSVSSFDPDDYVEPLDDDDCTLCGGEGYQECTDPIQCMAPHIGSPEYPECPCIGCGGSGHARDQRIW
jgi:hypothetical protein